MVPPLWGLMKHSVGGTGSNISSKGTAGSIVSSTKSRDDSISPLEARVLGGAGFPNGDDGAPSTSDVVVVGAGPAGLMLASNLARFGIKVQIIDDRAERTSTGRADGLQPKTIETLRQMRIAGPVLRRGVRIYDIAFWSSTAKTPLRRTGRETHYPPVIDLLDPYILLAHQGMIEQLFLDDLQERGIRVKRSTAFMDFGYLTGKTGPVEVLCEDKVTRTPSTMTTQYLIGCDGAHSRVRKCLIGSRPTGSSFDAIWGVLDGELETDFPDLWSKAVVYSEEAGSVLLIPRERNLTRLYIELKPDTREGTSPKQLTQEFVMSRAQEIMHPYSLTWRTVEWFSRYQVGQRVASRFTDDAQKVFICGDASHTHSPKAAQGMNTSMHDALNLAWKLNLTLRGLAKPQLLATYEDERRKIAQDLISFDYDHANAFAAGNANALAENFKTNVRFISGVGAEYNPNVINVLTKASAQTPLKPGCLLLPAKVTRFIDANPIDIQLDIPMLGQFRIYIFTHNVHRARPFLHTISSHHTSKSSFVGRMTALANASCTLQPPAAAESDIFSRPERYTAVSDLFTYALVTDMSKDAVEISDLPAVFKDSRWTFYLDDCPEKDTRGQKCMDKWLGGLGSSEVVVLHVRPDNYVGTLNRFPDGSKQSGMEAVRWLDRYYEGFLAL